MAGSRLLTPLLATALLAAVLAPTAAAHTTVFSDDGRYRIVVGQLEEPVITRQKTGLDLCFTLNTTAREPVSIQVADFQEPAGHATLVGPGGEELSGILRTQFGRPGCYQFEEPYVLTKPGQYTLSLKGQVNGTAIELSGVKAGGAVLDQDDLLFPAAAEPNGGSVEDAKGAPLPAAALLMVGLAALAAVRRLRA